MRLDAVPPMGIGLLAGLLTTAGAVALSATGLLPVWIATPLLYLAGGLAAGFAAPSGRRSAPSSARRPAYSPGSS